MSDNRQNPPIQTLTEETPANANLVAKLEPTTPNLRLPLPGYTLDVDLARIRDAFLKVDALSVSLEDNNEQAAATADDALEVAAQAKREAERATATAAEAVSIAESKATAADVEAHNRTKDAHGATSEPEPGAIALRDAFGRIKIGLAVEPGQAANVEYVAQELAEADTAMKEHVTEQIAAIDRVPEAPNDHKIYGRCNNTWKVVPRGDRRRMVVEQKKLSGSSIALPSAYNKVVCCGTAAGNTVYLVYMHNTNFFSVARFTVTDSGVSQVLSSPCLSKVSNAGYCSAFMLNGELWVIPSGVTTKILYRVRFDDDTSSCSVTAHTITNCPESAFYHPFGKFPGSNEWTVFFSGYTSPYKLTFSGVTPSLQGCVTIPNTNETFSSYTKFAMMADNRILILRDYQADATSRLLHTREQASGSRDIYYAHRITDPPGYLNNIPSQYCELFSLDPYNVLCFFPGNSDAFPIGKYYITTGFLCDDYTMLWSEPTLFVSGTAYFPLIPCDAGLLSCRAGSSELTLLTARYES